MEKTFSSTTSTMHRESTGKEILGGVITGQIAGLIMAVVVMLVFTIFLGKSPLYPVQVIGSAVFGAEALNGFHAGAVLSGLVLHQAGPSLLWGLLYGFLAQKVTIENPKSALSLGLIVGLISMVGPYFLIPKVMLTLHGVDFWNQEVPMFWDWAAHIVFGASFALYPMIMNKLGRKG
jgi:uncharacterized membrane protein